MPDSDVPERFVIVLVGLLLLLSPAVLLVATLAFLDLTGNLVLGKLTPLELIELYLIDLVLIATIAGGMIALLRRLVRRNLPDSLDALNSTDDGAADDTSEADAGADRDRDRTG